MGKYHGLYVYGETDAIVKTFAEKLINDTTIVISSTVSQRRFTATPLLFKPIKDRGSEYKQYSYDVSYSPEWGICPVCSFADEDDYSGYLPEPSEDRLVVDHCHRHGWIRGRICFYCNIALPMGAQDDMLESLKHMVAQFGNEVNIPSHLSQLARCPDCWETTESQADKLRHDRGYWEAIASQAINIPRFPHLGPLQVPAEFKEG
jgi:hypothetical protein